MKSIRLSELAFENVNITDVSAALLYWQGEDADGFFADSGEGEHTLYYVLDGKYEVRDAADNSAPTALAGGDVVYVASGVPSVLYAVSDVNYTKGHIISIKFNMTDLLGEQVATDGSRVVWQDTDGGLSQSFYTVLENYLCFKSNSLLVKNAMYGILASMCDYITERECESSHFKQIIPAVNYIETHLFENTSIAELASMCDMSESYFRTKFKAFSDGVSPADYRNRLRIEKSKELLASSLWTTDMIAEALGFYDTSHFYKIYKKVTGELPRGMQNKR